MTYSDKMADQVSDRTNRRALDARKSGFSRGGKATFVCCIVEASGELSLVSIAEQRNCRER